MCVFLLFLVRDFVIPPRPVSCAVTIILADAPGDVACAASLYDNGLHMGLGVDATVSNPGGSATGLTWWGTMNGGLYEESPPPVSTPVSSPHAVSITVVSATTAASTSPSSSSATSNTTGPLHIPAKRLSAYDGTDGGSVIRHSHPAQPWNYAESPQFEHQYPSTPPYYNLDGGRDARKLGFWPPVTASPPEYKYNPAGPVSAGAEHQGFASQTWCNYAPYPTARHDPHAHQPVPYSIQDDRRVAAAAMVAAAEGGFPHDGYGLRNYPDPVPSTPYPPPGKFYSSC